MVLIFLNIGCLKILGRMTLKPVTLFPEWYVVSSQAGSDIWALNPKALSTFISYIKVMSTADFFA